MYDYFIGIRLPKKLEEACEHYRRAFRAPRTIAHITVVAPFNWDQSVAELHELLKEAVQPLAPFLIRGSGLGSFGTRVLFVNVTLSEELLQLHKNLTAGLQGAGVKVDRRPYHPHITLATRLSPVRFYRYKQELEGFSPSYAFPCTAISLFEFTADRRWEEQAQIALPG